MSKVEFQITSVQGVWLEKECVQLFMRVNGLTCNAINTIDCFETYESAKLTLNAVIEKFLKHCYPLEENK